MTPPPSLSGTSGESFGVGGLQFDGVSRDFQTPGRGIYRALEDISFDVAPGAFVAIVGPSGCGKSTLLNIAAGLLTPSSGVVRVDGAALSGLNRHATYMFQQDALLPWKTIRDNVALGLTLGGARSADAAARADAWLARVGLSEFAAHYPSQLSGGMRKRAAMAQNWIVDRSMVLMDEPFSALDVHTRQRMESELLTLWESASFDSRFDRRLAQDRDDAAQNRVRKTIVFVTHDLEEAIVLADEVVVMAAGPASRVVARHPVTLERPRDLMELRTSPAFIDLYRAIWAVLRTEVVRSQREGVNSRG
jgi:NitT/TauT family transport system ATP-binding protein